MLKFTNSYDDGHEHDFISHFANPRRCYLCGVGKVTHEKNIREGLAFENAKPKLCSQHESCPMWPTDKEKFSGV